MPSTRKTRVTKLAIVAAVVMTILSLPGCPPEDSEQVIEKAQEEVKKAAQKAFDDAVDTATKRITDAMDPGAQHACPKCQGPCSPRGDGDRHHWWYCSACRFEFATYDGGHPNNRFPAGYCTWYAQDRWLYDGNTPVFKGNACEWFENAPLAMQTQVPSAGCVAVYRASGKNSAGHVAYVVSATGVSYTVWEMNAGSPATMDRDYHTQLFNCVTKATRSTTPDAGGSLRLEGFIKPSE